jgi:hypothetical protein
VAGLAAVVALLRARSFLQIAHAADLLTATRAIALEMAGLAAVVTDLVSVAATAAWKKKVIGRAMGRMGRTKLAHRRGNPASNVLHFHMYGTSYPTFCKDRSAQADRMYGAGRATNGRWMQAIDPGHYFGADGQHHDSGNTAPPGGRTSLCKTLAEIRGSPPEGT